MKSRVHHTQSHALPRICRGMWETTQSTPKQTTWTCPTCMIYTDKRETWLSVHMQCCVKVIHPILTWAHVHTVSVQCTWRDIGELLLFCYYVCLKRPEWLGTYVGRLQSFFVHTSKGDFEFKCFGSFQLPSSVNMMKAAKRLNSKFLGLVWTKSDQLRVLEQCDMQTSVVFLVLCLLL